MIDWQLMADSDSPLAEVAEAASGGRAADVIVDTATEERASAVAMATRGHSGLGREVVGSVAEYVLRHAGPLATVLVGPRAAVPARSETPVPEVGV